MATTKSKSRARKPAAKMLAGQLRELIESSGMTNYQLAGRAEIAESMVWRFMGGADLKLETAGRIAEVLGVELVRTKRRSSPARKVRSSPAPEDDEDQIDEADTAIP